MIGAAPDPDTATLAARLEAKARALGEARARQAALEQRGDSRRWRHAGLLWPLFAKGG